MDTHHLVAYGILLLGCFTYETSHAMETHYMDEICSTYSPKKTIYVSSTVSSDSSGIIKASRYGGYSNNYKCTVVLEPLFPSHYLVVALRKIYFRSGCDDNLTITDSDTSYGKKTTYCSYLSDSMGKSVLDGTKKVTLDFKTSSGFVNSARGFELIYTAYTVGYCSSWTYKCDNGRCISEDLTCDGNNHCGDKSDQDYCELSTGGKVGVSFGTIFLVIAIIAGIVACHRRRSARVIQTTLHPPTVQPYTIAQPAQQLQTTAYPVLQIQTTAYPPPQPYPTIPHQPQQTYNEGFPPPPPGYSK